MLRKFSTRAFVNFLVTLFKTGKPGLRVVAWFGPRHGSTATHSVSVVALRREIVVASFDEQEVRRYRGATCSNRLVRLILTIGSRSVK